MKYKILHVSWIDSETADGWEELKDQFLETLRVETVGLLIKETKDNLVIAHSIDPTNENLNGRIKIPKVSILSRKLLTYVEIEA